MVYEKSSHPIFSFLIVGIERTILAYLRLDSACQTWSATFLVVELFWNPIYL